MNSANEITEELKEMGSTLAGMSRAMPYAVPAGYFEERFTVSSLKLADAAEPAINFSKSMPYPVPAGYFEGLAADIVTAIGNEHSAEPAISYSKAMPHTVPGGYFEAMSGKVLDAVKRVTPVKKKATVIALDNAFRRMRWAAAAVLLVCISLGSYISFFSDSPESGTEMMLASVPNDEINDYLQRAGVIDAEGIVSNNDINKMQIDNTDIEQYLNETGWDVLD